MLIHYYNKETGECQIFGGRKAASNYTGVPIDWFYYQFNENRGGKKQEAHGNHQFSLREIIRSKRK